MIRSRRGWARARVSADVASALPVGRRDRGRCGRHRTAILRHRLTNPNRLGKLNRCRRPASPCEARRTVAAAQPRLRAAVDRRVGEPARQPGQPARVCRCSRSRRSHASTFAVGALSAVEFAPFLLVGLPAGVIVDRRRRRPVLMLGDIGRAIVLFSIPVAWWLGVLTLGAALRRRVHHRRAHRLLRRRVPVVPARARRVRPARRRQRQARDEPSRARRSPGPGLAGALVQTRRCAGRGRGRRGELRALGDLGVSSSAAPSRRSRRRPIDERPTMRAEIGEGLRYVLGHPALRGDRRVHRDVELLQLDAHRGAPRLPRAHAALQRGAHRPDVHVRERRLPRRGRGRGTGRAVAAARPDDLDRRSSSARSAVVVVAFCAARARVPVARRGHGALRGRRHDLQHQPGELPAGDHAEPDARAHERDDAVHGVGHDAARIADRAVCSARCSACGRR